MKIPIRNIRPMTILIPPYMPANSEYSEFAGIYGGINIVIGLMFLIGIFKQQIGLFSIKILVFLVGSIALGRFLLMLLGSQAGLPVEINTFLIFEIVVFSIGMIFIKVLKDTN